MNAEGNNAGYAVRGVRYADGNPQMSAEKHAPLPVLPPPESFRDPKGGSFATVYGLFVR